MPEEKDQYVLTVMMYGFKTWTVNVTQSPKHSKKYGALFARGKEERWETEYVSEKYNKSSGYIGWSEEIEMSMGG